MRRLRSAASFALSTYLGFVLVRAYAQRRDGAEYARGYIAGVHAMRELTIRDIEGGGGDDRH